MPKYKEIETKAVEKQTDINNVYNIDMYAGNLFMYFDQG